MTPSQFGLLADAVRAFDQRVRGLRVTPPAEVGRHVDARVCCHPFVTTEADFQRWFGAAMESAFQDMAVHAEVYAFARRRGGAARCDLSLHARKLDAIERDADIRSPALLVELKVLTVGRRDRSWRAGTPPHALRQAARIRDDALRVRDTGGAPLVCAVFVEPLAYEIDSEERTRVEARVADLFRRVDLCPTTVVRADGAQACVTLVTLPNPMEPT